jgi:two-component system sensor histidine kinase BaeS
LVVEDSAPGVPAEQLPQLFEPLHRGDAARNASTGGSGLGLAICQVIAKAHGGELNASASELGGLRLTLDLPQRPDQRQPLTAGSVP